MATTKEPQWLGRQVVEAIHDVQLANNGGLPGLRDAGALESALGCPMHRWHYGEAEDLADCAAAYGFGIAKNHPFADANKRTAFVVMATFCELNGQPLTASEEDVVQVMVGVADGSISEKRLAAWLRDNTATPLTGIKLFDTVPPYTQFKSALCLTLPARGITGCTATAQPTVGSSGGSLGWTMTDATSAPIGLQPLDAGSVSFCVQVQSN